MWMAISRNSKNEEGKMKGLIKRVKRWFVADEVMVWVLARSGDVIEYCKGNIRHEVGVGRSIRYRWLDDKVRSFIARKMDKVGVRGDGVDVYAHRVGDLWVSSVEGFISDEFYEKITNSDIGSRIVDNVKDIREREGWIDWKKILIVVGVIILVIVLWKTGWLPKVLGEVIPSGGS